MSESNYEVVVGNLGRVWLGTSGYQANIEFGDWKVCSMSAHHRASGEEVTLFKDGEIKHEYTPKNDGVTSQG